MKAWEEFLAVQEKELGTETVKKWLRPLRMLRFDAWNLYLEASDSFQALWFEEHIRSRLNKFVSKNNKKIKVHLSTAQPPPAAVETAPKAESPSQERSTAPQPFFLTFDEVDPSSTLENFISFESNQLAYKVIQQIIQDPQGTSSFNPLFVYGKTGVGKTHLLMAAAQELKRKGMKVLYTRAETFTDHVIRAIRAGEMQVFRKIYRNAEVLLIDDVQVFSRKGATQEELFHTFNTLHLEGRHLILSANCAPGELTFIEPRLVSRFEWGIVLHLESPQREDLKRILQHRANNFKFDLRDEVVTFLLDSFTSNPKTLCRALEALILRTHLQQNSGKSLLLPLSLAYAKSFVSDLIVEEQHSALTPQKVIEAVALYYGIQTQDILGKSQKRESSLPRQIAMYLCRTQLTLPFVKIGEIFSRDHSTVMSSVRQVQNSLAEKNNELSSIVNTISKRLR